LKNGRDPQNDLANLFINALSAGRNSSCEKM